MRKVLLLERLVVRLLPREQARLIVGDINERYTALCAQGDTRHAGRWRRRQLWSCLAPHVLAQLWWEHGCSRARGGERRAGLRLDGRALLLDVKHGLRRMARQRFVSVASMVMVALGVTGLVFVHGVFDRLLHPVLRVPESESLFHVLRAEGRQLSMALVPAAEYQALRAALPEQSAAAYATTAMAVRWRDDVGSRTVAAVSESYFRVTGGRLLQGRLPAAPHELVLSHAYWRRLGEPSVLGASLHLDGQPFTVVGVMAREFGGLEGASLWLPMSSAHAAPVRVTLRLNDLAARARVLATLSRLASTSPVQYELQDARARRAPLAEVAAINTAIRVVTLLAFFLLIAVTANGANLAAVDTLRRARERAVRRALGASRTRLVLQVVREKMVQALLAACFSMICMAAFYRALPAWLPAGDPDRTFALDARSLLLAALLAALVTLLTEVLPVVLARGPAMSSPWSTARTRSLPRDALVSLQIVQAVALIVVAGLLTHSQREIRGQSLGFQVEHSHILAFTLPGTIYDTSRVRAIRAAVLQQLSGAPAITAAALSSATPVIGGVPRTVSAGATVMAAPVLRVSPAYLQAMGTTLRQGRAFRSAEPARVALISIETARQLFPGRSPLGRPIRVDGIEQPFEVVGVVESGTQGGVVPAPQVLLPLDQSYARSLTLIVRSARRPAELTAFVRSVMRAITADVAVESMGSLETLLDRSHLLTRALTALATLFGLLGLVIGCLGVFAHFTHEVQSRRRDIGIRLAMGASMSDIVRALTRRMAAVTGLGLILGSLLALTGAYLARAMLFRTSTAQPAALLAGNLVIALCAGLAILVPAVRAARVAPTAMLGTE
jgi:putative ABC transport system permease protein